MTRPIAPRLLAALVGIVLVWLPTACGEWNPDVDTRSATQGIPDTKVDLVADAWRLDGAAGSPRIDSAASTEAAEVTLDFKPDGTVRGRGPCNSYSGTFEVGDGTVTITDVISTLMGCEEAVMDDEAAFHGALASVEDVTFSADHERLTLTGPGGLRLEFESYDPYR